MKTKRAICTLISQLQKLWKKEREREESGWKKDWNSFNLIVYFGEKERLILNTVFINPDIYIIEYKEGNRLLFGLFVHGLKYFWFSAMPIGKEPHGIHS